jgi:hypothetical protein
MRVALRDRVADSLARASGLDGSGGEARAGVEDPRLALGDAGDRLPPRGLRARGLRAEVGLAAAGSLVVLGDLVGREREVVEGHLVDDAVEVFAAIQAADEGGLRAAGPRKRGRSSFQTRREGYPA